MSRVDDLPRRFLKRIGHPDCKGLMFGNFIHFIVVLLIYATYQPTDTPGFSVVESTTLFFGLFLGYAGLTRVLFRRLERRISTGDFQHLDHLFNRMVTRHSILAIVFFGIDIYVLNLVEAVQHLSFLSMLPTVQALIFISVFIGYLAVLWSVAFDAYRKLYGTDLNRRRYTVSNLAVSIPVLLPWVLLSGFADLVRLLPFESLKRFLSSSEGEIIYFFCFLMIVAVMGPLLIQKFWRCTPLPSGYERSRIEALCRRAGLAYADILNWPLFEGRMITAGVMGLVRRYRYILVTDALLRLLRPEEVDAVIAHEIGHVKRNHILFYLFFFVGYILFSYAVFDLIVYGILLSEPLYRFIIQSGVSQAAMTSTLITLATILVFLVYFRYVFGYFMRNFERQADCYVYTLFNTAGPLISTFEKITLTSGQSPDRPNWHHFSIAERVKYLIKCEQDRRWVRRHDRKVRRSILLYGAAMTVIAVMAYSLNFGDTGKALNANLFERILQRELQQQPDSPELFGLLGDFHYSRNQYAKAAEAYENAIRLGSESAEVFNNLAWLYATCEDASLRFPARALDLAKKASERSNAPHIWDTLAESYFVNGRYEAAVQAGERAYAAAKTDRSYFESQLKKFRRAARID